MSKVKSGQNDEMTGSETGHPQIAPQGSELMRALGEVIAVLSRVRGFGI